MTAIIDIGTLIVRTPDTCGDRHFHPRQTITVKYARIATNLYLIGDQSYVQRDSQRPRNIANRG